MNGQGRGNQVRVGGRKVTDQEIVNIAAEVAIAACALIFAAEDPARWEQFQNFAGSMGGPLAKENGVLTRDYGAAAAGRLVALANAAMESTEPGG